MNALLRLCPALAMAASLSLLTMPLVAQDRERSARRASARQYQFQGQVTRVEQAAVRGTQHTFVALKTDEGQRLVADLGPTQNLRRLDLERGADVSLRGTATKVENKKILVADVVESGRRRINVDRNERDGRLDDLRTEAGQRRETRQTRREQRRQWIIDAVTGYFRDDQQPPPTDPQAPQVEQGQEQSAQEIEGRQTLTVSGEVLATRARNIGDAGRLLAYIETPQQTRRVVDLGLLRDLDVRVKRGDEITVTGTAVELPGRGRIVAADKLEVDGRTVEIRQVLHQNQIQQRSGHHAPQ